MHLNHVATLLVVSSLLIGCDQKSRRPLTDEQQSIQQIRQLHDQIIGLPIAGFWITDGKGGEFHISFQKLTTNGHWVVDPVSRQTICTVSGTGKLWLGPATDQPFAVNGHLTGRLLSLELRFSDQALTATGQLEGDDLLSSTCTLTINFPDKARQARLNCRDSIDQAHAEFSASL